MVTRLLGRSPVCLWGSKGRSPSAGVSGGRPAPNKEKRVIAQGVGGRPAPNKSYKSSRVTPPISITRSGPYAFAGVWKPGCTSPASTRRTTSSAVSAVSVYAWGVRIRETARLPAPSVTSATRSA